MKLNKKILLYIIFLIILVAIFIPKSHNFIITGTYQSTTNSFNSLVFDENIKAYFDYSQNEKSKGVFTKNDTNTYILENGTLNGYTVKLINKNELQLIKNNIIENYKKKSNIPTLR